MCRSLRGGSTGFATNMRQAAHWVLVSLIAISVLGALAACGETAPAEPDAEPPCVDGCECSVDSDCPGEHTVCEVDGDLRTCGCAAGYQATDGGACAWAGVLENPGFSSAEHWEIDGGAVIEGTLNAAGMLDPGAARFMSGEPLCKLSRLTQTVTMPRFSRAEPLVAQVSFRLSGGFETVLPSIGFGEAFGEPQLTVGGAWRTGRICLGASHYAPESSTGPGVPRTFTVMPNRITSECNSARFEVDRVDIVPAGPHECPAPGTAVNGDGEGVGGWVFTVSGNSTGTFASGAGEAGSKGVRLLLSGRCESAAALDPISVPVPADVPSPALSFFHRATTGSMTLVGLNNLALPLLAGNGSGTTHRACLPAFMRGAVAGLRALVSSGSGACADVVNSESVFDNVQVVNEPSCGTDVNLTDPGFESPFELLGAVATPGKSIARTLAEPGVAHGGTGVLQLSQITTCSDPSWVANVVTPAPAANGGPALSFHYRAAIGSKTKFSVSSGFGPAFSPVQDNTWRQGVVCLNPYLSGRNHSVAFAVRFVGGACDQLIPAETAYVDDLAATTDPSCPSM